MPSQVKNMSNCNNVMCGCEIYISKSMMQRKLYSCGSRNMEKIRIAS